MKRVPDNLITVEVSCPVCGLRSGFEKEDSGEFHICDCGILYFPMYTVYYVDTNGPSSHLRDIWEELAKSYVFGDD